MNENFINFYSFLGIGKNATLKEIKSAYRLLAKKYHPDVSKESGAHEKFIIINEAYLILSNESSRREYDFIYNQIISSNTYEKTNIESIIYEKTQKIKYVYECIHCGFEDSNDFVYCPICEKNDDGMIKPMSLQMKKIVSFIRSFSINSFSISIFVFMGCLMMIVFNGDLRKQFFNSSQDSPEISRIDNSQKPLLSGWKRIHIDNTGIINIPPSMEIDSLQKLSEDRNKTTVLVIKSKISRSATIIVNTAFMEPGKLENLDHKWNLSEETMEEMNTGILINSEQVFSQTGDNLVRWYPFEIASINGLSCFHTHYIKQNTDSISIEVNTYGFQNYDRQHTITFSCFINEKNKWEKDFENILNTFWITKIE